MAESRFTKDIVYNLLKEPNLATFREFMRNEAGEQDTVEFKREWIDDEKLAKEMIAIANVGGGLIVFGVEDGKGETSSPVGIDKFKDKAKVSNQIANFIPAELEYDIYDFDFDSSEYSALENKKFQLLVITDKPTRLPYLPQKDGKNLYENRIYIRRGTSIEEASKEDIANMLDRRLRASYPDTDKPATLEEHLQQLKTLYENINDTVGHYEGGLAELLAKQMKSMVIPVQGNYVSESNPFYPNESYDEFLSKMITAKKHRIERALDLSHLDMNAAPLASPPSGQNGEAEE